MHDSQTPIELEDLQANGGAPRRSPVPGMIVATLLGMATAGGLFVFLRGNNPPDPAEHGFPEARDVEPEFNPHPPENSPKQNTATESSESPVPSGQEPDETSLAGNSSRASESADSGGNDAAGEAIPEPEPLVAERPQLVSHLPPRLPDRAKPLRLDTPIDLIALFEPSLHTLQGTWTKRDGTLTSGKDITAILSVPVEFPPSYVLRLRLRTVEGDDSFYLKLKVRENETFLVMNGWHSTQGGLHRLDGREASDRNNETRFERPMIGQDRFSDVVVVVQDESVLATLDEQVIVDWTGDSKRLATSPEAPDTTFGHPRIDAVRTRYEIVHYSLTPIVDQSLAAVPDDDAIRQTEKDLESRFDISFRVSRNSDKLDFARKLQAFLVTESHPAARYVLLSHALKNASEAGDFGLSMQLCDQLDSEFAVPVRLLKQTAIEQVSKSNRDPLSSYQLALICSDLAWEAADEHQYNEATSCLKTASSLAKSSRVKILGTQLDEVASAFERWRRAYEPIRESHAAVERGAATEEDFLAWGRFLCLVREDWKAGLPVLRRGGDSELARLARDELEAPREFEPIIRVSRQWMDRSAEHARQEKLALETHARKLALTAKPWADAMQLPLIELSARELFDVKTIWDTSRESEGILIGGESANPGVEATIEFWVRTTDHQGGCLMKREQEREQCIGVSVRNGNAVLFLNGSFYFERSPSQAFISDGRWHHIAVSKVDKYLRLFVDGIPVAEQTARDRFPRANSSGWRLGNHKWVRGGHLAAEFARVRVSSVSRYHARFLPERTYDSDRTTLLLQ
jgi:hypothetical protein